MAGDTALEHLARVLAKNYFDTSQTLFDTSAVRSADARALAVLRETGQRVFTDPDGGELAARRPERTVLVVGAGASSGAFGDACPGTEAALQELQRVLAGSRPDRARAPDGPPSGEDPEQTGSGDAPGHFERALAALAQEHGDARVREELVRMYGNRYRPHLSFEIIAHLFKHRFIDAIINFNLDELLDEAIEGEMGTAEYQRVYFEGQCRGLDPLLVDSRLKVPLYIKPHGTVSYPSSIRFLPDPASPLPDPMHQLIASIIGGHWIDDPRERPHEYRPYHVNLITLGFAMNSVHLLSILRDVAGEAGNDGITIYHLNRGAGVRALRQAASGRNLAHVRELFIDVDEHEGLAETLRSVWTATKKHFKDAFGPRGIARHEIVHNLFFAGGRDGTGKRVPSRGDAPYLRARLTAEVAMAIARGNGVIDLGTMAESRVGKTFDLLRSHPEGRNISMHDILKALSQSDKVTFDGRDNSVFRFPYEHASSADELNRNLAHALWECLHHALGRTADVLFANHLKNIWQSRSRTEKMVERFRQLASSDAHDISPTFRNRHLLLSQQQRPEDVIHTSLGLTLRFVEMMNDAWDLMLAISETGKVMEQYRRHVKNGSITDPRDSRRFCLILAGNDHPEIAARRLEPLYGQMVGLSNPPLFYVPEWAHNQHMVLLLKRTGAGYRTQSAVRYETPRLGNRVNPVFIRKESRADLDAALECFKRYLHVSVAEYQPGGADGHVDAKDALRQLSPDALWERLLAEMDEGGGSAKPGRPAPHRDPPERSESPEGSEPPGHVAWG
jgi:hypothetical protein